MFFFFKSSTNFESSEQHEPVFDLYIPQTVDNIDFLPGGTEGTLDIAENEIDFLEDDYKSDQYNEEGEEDSNGT